MNFEKIKEDLYFYELSRSYLNLKTDMVLHEYDEAKQDDQLMRLLECYANTIFALGRSKAEQLITSAIRYSYVDDKENDFGDLSDDVLKEINNNGETDE